MAVDYCNGEYFHFQLYFYADPDHENILGTVDSRIEWYNFYANGTQFAAEGIFVCENDCVTVEYRVPFDAPKWMFNRQLYVRISKPFKTFDISVGGGGSQAAIVICIDQSGSMEDEVAWLPEMIDGLETKLLEEGIGPNLWGLVGFGGVDNDSAAYVHFFNGSQKYGNASQISDYIATGNLLPLGGLGSGIEDGFEAIDHVFKEYEILDEVPMNIILVTDEDRDNRVSSLNKTGIIQYITQSKARLNVIVNYSLISNDGQAIGVGQDGTSFVADGIGGYIMSDGGAAGSGFGTTFADYIDLSWTVAGYAWDLNLLRVGGLAAQSFTTAFTNGMVEDIKQSFVCFDSVTPEAFEFTCVRTEDDAIPIDVTNRRPTDGCLHARITFYADATRTSIVQRSFSMLDQRRWFVNNNPPCRVSPSGVIIGAGQNIRLSYKADILPIDQMENQPEFSVFGGQFEKPLVCGVKYYVTVEAYWGDTSEFETINEYEYIGDCDRIRAQAGRFDFDAGNWVSSGQGRFDTRVTETKEQCLYPTVAGTLDGKYMIAWQDHRGTTNNDHPFSFKASTYYGIYDRDQDIFWSSGQGHTDTLAISTSTRPVAFRDASDNFIMIAPTDSKTVKVWKCILADTTATAASATPSTTCVLTDERYAQLDVSLRDNEQYLKVRVYEEDLSSSFVTANGATVGVVEDYIIRLEISGLPSSYAVRLRNEDDKDWSAWINIDRPLQTTFEYDDILLSAYSLDNDRCVVPWVVSCGSGLKRVCIQVLTYYGISKTFCCDIFANIRDLDYVVEMSYTNTFATLAPMFDGVPVISHGGNANGRMVYVRVKFTDGDQLDRYRTKLSQWTKYNYLTEGLTFNVVQQGLGDIAKLTLTPSVTPTIYTGFFTVKPSDGIFNKDGLAAITVSLPTPCLGTIAALCGTDSTDPYNRADVTLMKEFTKSGTTIQDISVDTVLSSSVTSITKPPLSIVPSLQDYSADDPRFSFGNPAIYRRKGQ
ncbi:MAG: hypothetical protein HC888_01370 [Candidatus Competibacteraceae bacterium]|nr:hypothetical protein [Candidatus Competibacteraceae bacterium]